MVSNLGTTILYSNLVEIAFECSSEVLCASVLVKSGLENRDYGCRGPAALTMRHPSIKMALTSPRSGGRSVGMVRSRTKATELAFFPKIL
jgi:hypothetical protein